MVMKAETSTSARKSSVFKKKATQSVLAVAMSLLLLPSPALANDGGLGLAASTAGTIAADPLPTKEPAPTQAPSDSSQSDASSAEGSSTNNSQQNAAMSSDDQPKSADATLPVTTVESAHADEHAADNPSAATTTKPSETTELSANSDATALAAQSLTPAAVGSSFTANLTVGTQSCPCTFTIISDTEVQVGDGTNAAISTDSAGSIIFAPTVTNPADGKSYTVNKIGDHAFMSCDDITATGLNDPDCTITSVGSYAFEACDSLRNTGLRANSSVKSIGEEAFRGCGALLSTQLDQNASVTSLGSGVFEGCTALKDSGLFGNTKITAIPSEAFSGCSALLSTGLGGNPYVTSIGDSAFSGCILLTDTGLATNKSIVSLGGNAFSSCSALAHAAIGSSVTSIGAACFDSDAALQDVCFYGNWAPSDSTWLGTLSATPITVYYLAGHLGWKGKTAAGVARASDFLKALSVLLQSGDEVSLSPASSYWSSLPGSATLGLYAQGDAVTIKATGDSFLKWASDDASGVFADPYAASTTYTVGAPESGTATLTVFPKGFDNTINVGGKDVPCTFVVSGDGTVQIGNGSDAAVEPGLSGDVILPSKVSYLGTVYTVNRIADSAFKNCTGFTSTGLAGNTSMISIGASAFMGCTHIDATGLSATSSVASMGANAFNGCTALKDTGLAADVKLTSVGAGAFRGCTSLKSTGLANNTGLTAVNASTFQGCTSLTSTDLAEDDVVQDAVTSIGANAFQGCTALSDDGLASNTTVMSIGDGAFANTALSNVAIGSAVTSFGSKCFDGDDVRSVCFYGKVPPQDSTWLGTRKSVGTPIAAYYFSEDAGWSGKTPAAVTGSADDSLKPLSLVHIDDNKGSISPATSSYWAGLKGSASYGRYAQGDKASIAAAAPLVFLRWTSNDASGAFADATAASTTYTVGAPTSGLAKLTVFDSHFSSTISIGGNKVPCTYAVSNDGTAQIGDGTAAAVDPKTAGGIALPATVDYGGKTYTVTSIANQAFTDCIGITATGLASNKSITSIGDNAFNGCAALAATGLDSNSSVISVGTSAFQGCTGLKDTGLAGNKSLSEVGWGVFADCTGLTSTGLAFNTKVVTVGDSAFQGCTSLADTGLGSNTTVTALKGSAFQDCTALASTGLTGNSHVAAVGTAAFQGCIALKDTGLASNPALSSLGERVFSGCTALKDTGLGKNTQVTSVGQGSFSNCSAMPDTGLATNKAVTSLGVGAFKGCTSLAHAAVGGAVASLGRGCFDGDAALKDVCFYGTAVPSGPAWLGTPSAAPVTVCYLAEDSSWAKDGRAALRPADALCALSRLTVDGGSAAQPANHWASVAGATSGRYAQGEWVPVSASDSSAFLRWATDDSLGSFADASSASTAYAVGAPASGTAVLSIVPQAPEPVNPDSPGASDDSNGGIENGGFSDSGELAPGSVLGSNTVETPKSTSSNADSQSTGTWYSEPSHDGSDNAASSTDGSAGDFSFTPPAAVAIAAGVALLVAAILGLVLVRRRK